MFPPTPDQLATEAHVDPPTGITSPGAAWLLATAARAAEIQQQLAEGQCRDALLTLHAHYAIEDPRYDLDQVAADLGVPLCRHARRTGHAFATEVALFRVARSLLDTLTTADVVAAPRSRGRNRGPAVPCVPVAIRGPSTTLRGHTNWPDPADTR